MTNNVFYTAIEAHIKWKIRLQKYLEGTSEEKLDPEVICRDNECVLGKWIYGDGIKYSTMPAYQNLKQTHALFHHCASQVVRKTDEGQANEAKQILSNEYSGLSRDITRMLVKMNTTLSQLK